MQSRWLNTTTRLWTQKASSTLARTALAVTEKTKTLLNTEDSEPHILTPLTQKDRETPTEQETLDRLFESLGDLGDKDGLNVMHEQRVMHGRNQAGLLADFYKTLSRKGVDVMAAGELTQMYFNRVLEEEEIASEAIVSFYDDDDD